ncbi:MarR family winged helix-turn-helix transcriptional regulator [Arthrobacter sp. PvP023]|uniref:MarR family winged helix-turn-helix transcriptional regulator n=2 Tax=Micrococcaceae TaxID=1268 RepID=UPI001AE431F6|nr:MarR family transcriptional regulator [Arthrobacter sp. PvP023]
MPPAAVSRKAGNTHMALAQQNRPAGWSTHRLLSTAARLDERRINRQLVGLGLTKSSFDALDCVEELGPATQNCLADELGITAQSLGKILDRLKDLGLLTKERGAGDGRSRSVRLTPRGRSVLRTAEELVRGLPRPERDVEVDLRRHLEQHIAHLTDSQQARAEAQT